PTEGLHYQRPEIRPNRFGISGALCIVPRPIYRESSALTAPVYPVEVPLPHTATGFSADLALALRLADAADAQTLPRFDAADLQVSVKADRSHVTDADLAAERAIRDLLHAERPGDGVL